eukprot:COSAG02_NODE_1004_length_15275_cov_11.955917_18_plen_62_part_01
MPLPNRQQTLQLEQQLEQQRQKLVDEQQKLTKNNYEFDVQFIYSPLRSIRKTFANTPAGDRF